jgi:ribosomal protein S18 acetylase RimI-like enzyme
MGESRAPSSAPLSCQIEEFSQDPEWTLAHFPFVTDATLRAERCDIICSPSMSIASYHPEDDEDTSLPSLSFAGDSPKLLGDYATFLVEPGTEVTLLVTPEQREVVEEALTVLEEERGWQMAYPGRLPAGGQVVAPLKPRHLSAMRTLIAASHIQPLSEAPLTFGPAFGVWEGRTLVGMVTTRAQLPGALQLGTLALLPGHEEQGYLEALLTAAAEAHPDESPRIFLVVHHGWEETLEHYEALGFERRRPLYRMRCRIEEVPEEVGAPAPPVIS